MKIVVFVRHGESELNVRHGLGSDLNKYPLTEKGAREASAIADQIAKLGAVDALYSSPVLRAFQTAEIIGRRIGREPSINYNIIERFPGTALNNAYFQSDEERDLNYKKEIESNYEHGMESWEKLQVRMLKFVSELKDGVTVAVSHADPILSILGTVDPSIDDLNFNIHISSGTMSVVDFEREKILCMGSYVAPKLANEG